MRQASDFRSDKVALPTREMMEAMVPCRWGDGQMDDGPDVRALEALAAKLTGKPAAMFVASGTQANQVAIHVHTQPCDAVVLDDHAHIFWTEGGGGPALSGVQTHALPSRRGRIRLDALAALFRRQGVGAPVRLVCMENTHNFGGGPVMPMEYLREVQRLARAGGAAVHCDGARIFNASVESGVPVSRYADTADSIMFCLSKGLCAPVGSMLCGTREFIRRARAFRERIGGHPKQSAPMAAAGLVALRTMVDRLAEDHANAARLARGLKRVRGLAVEPAETNMVFVTVTGLDGDSAVSALEKRGVRTYHLGADRLRFVTHRDVGAEDVDRAVAAFAAVMKTHRG